MDPPKEKRNLDPPEENRNWGRPGTEIVNFFRNLFMIVWTTVFFAFICWVFDSLNNGLDRLERYVLPEYEVSPPDYKPLTPAEYARLSSRMYEVMRRDLQMPIQHRTSARSERRSRPYDDPKTRNAPEYEPSSEINVGASSSGQSTASERIQEGGSGRSYLQQETGLGSSQQSQGLDNPQSPLKLEIDISETNPTSQPLDESSSLKKLIGPPTDSSTSSSVMTTENSENSSSDETFGTGKDLPMPEPPASPGISLDADTMHFSGGAVWEAPSPVQSPVLFSEDDFLKIASELRVTSGNDNLDQELMSIDVGGTPSHLTGGSVSEMTSVSPVHQPPLFSQEDFDSVRAGQHLPGTSPPLLPGIDVGASTSHLTGGSVLDTSPPPVSSPPLFSQDEFEKMSGLPGTSGSGTAEQRYSSLSPVIMDASLNNLPGGTDLEAAGPSTSSLSLISEEDFAGITSPQHYPELHRASARAERRSRPYDDPKARNTPVCEPPPAINVVSSAQSAASETAQGGTNPSYVKPQTSLNSSEQSQGLGNPHQSPLKLKIDISAANPTSQQLDEFSSLKKIIGYPTDSSSSSVITTENSENSSSDETFGTGKDLPMPEPPASPGISLDADTMHFSGGAVWEEPSPVQSPVLFSEDDFLKIASELPVTSGRENLDQDLKSIDVGGTPIHLTGVCASEMMSVTPEHPPPLFSREDFDSLRAGQQSPVTSPFSPGIDVGASTSHLTGGSVLDASPPPVSSPPLFSQKDFEKMCDLPRMPGPGTAEQSDISFSPVIMDVGLSHQTGGTDLETAGPSTSSLPLISEDDSAGTTSPQRYPSFSKFGEVASPIGTIGDRGSSANSPPSLRFVTSDVCTAQGPSGAEGGSEISDLHALHSRTIKSRMYVSLSDDDVHAAPKENIWFDEEVRSSSVEDLRSEASKQRRLKFRRRSVPMGEAIPRPTRILNLLDRMDVQATEEQLQEIVESNAETSLNNPKQETSDDDKPKE